MTVGARSPRPNILRFGQPVGATLVVAHLYFLFDLRRFALIRGCLNTSHLTSTKEIINYGLHT